MQKLAEISPASQLWSGTWFVCGRGPHQGVDIPCLHHLRLAGSAPSSFSDTRERVFHPVGILCSLFSAGSFCIHHFLAACLFPFNHDFLCTLLFNWVHLAFSSLLYKSWYLLLCAVTGLKSILEYFPLIGSDPHWAGLFTATICWFQIVHSFLLSSFPHQFIFFLRTRGIHHWALLTLLSRYNMPLLLIFGLTGSVSNLITKLLAWLS